MEIISLAFWIFVLYLFYKLVAKFVSINDTYNQKSFPDPKSEHDLFKSFDEALQSKNNADGAPYSFKPEHSIFKEVHQTVTNKPYHEYLPYVKRYCLMTNAELNFFKVLQKAVQDKYYIVPQVQLSKLIEVERRRKWQYSYTNMIDRKSVDFVLFNKENFKPYLVIELDDRSHYRWDRIRRDNFVDEVLNRVGIRIKHIKNSYQYNIDEITRIIN